MDFAPIIWLGLMIISGLKMFFDQVQLLKLYRREINPPHAVALGEKMNLADDPLGFKTSTRLTKIIFLKYPEHPNLARVARKVRMDILITVTIGIGGFILIALLWI